MICLTPETSSQTSSKELPETQKQPVDSCSSVTVEFNRMLLQEGRAGLNKPEPTNGSSCRHRVQQVGFLHRLV